MKKKAISMMMFSLCTLLGYSQVSWNVKAGANISGVTQWIGPDMKLGYQFGVGMDYYFTSHWGIQSSLLLMTKGYKSKGDYSPYPIEDRGDEKSYDIIDNRMYLDLPVMLAYKFNLSDRSKLVFSGGGFVGYGIGGKFKNKVTMNDGSTQKYSANTFSEGMEKFDVGLCSGISYGYKNYSLGIFGEWGLKKTLHITKNKTYGINIGYTF